MEAHPNAPFGAWLKEYRRLHGLSRAELGRRIGCAPETIQKIETGERRPSQQIAELLAVHLQIAGDQRAAFIEFARMAPPSGRTDPARGTPQEGVGTAGGPTAVFPLPPTSLSYAPPTNLRVPLTRLVGRQ